MFVPASSFDRRLVPLLLGVTLVGVACQPGSQPTPTSAATTAVARTADPRTFDEFDVTGIRVLDPLYPHGSAAWGASPRPNSLVSPETLAKQFVLRDSRRVNLGVPPGFLLVFPVAEA